MGSMRQTARQPYRGSGREVRAEACWGAGGTRPKICVLWSSQVGLLGTCSNEDGQRIEN